MFSFRTSKKSRKSNGDDPEDQVFVNVTNRTLFRVFIMFTAFLTLLLAIRQASQALVLVFTAFFLALALNAPVQWVAQHIPGKQRGNRSVATGLSVLIVFALLTAFIASIVPPFVRQISSLVDTAPQLVSDLRNEDTGAGKLIHRYNLESQVDSFSNDLADRLKGFSGKAVSVVASIGSSVFTTLTIVVLAFMMLVEGPRWVSIGEELIPDRHREHVRELSRAMYKVVKGYVNGQVLLAAIAAALIVPMLFILGISYPVALMVVVFICGLIPMVGHTLGAAIVTVVALFTSPLSALIILGYYILYQQIENYFVQPKIQANSTNMSPLLVFMAVVLGVNFGGLLGGLVAIPIMGCIRILVIDQLISRNILETKSAKATLAKAEATDN